MKRFGKIIRWMLLLTLLPLAAIVLVTVWITAVSNPHIFESTSEIPKQNVALVLGTTRYVAAGYENVYFTHRIRAAADLYHSGRVKKILVSGDNAIKYYDEPKDMRDALVEKGVPAGDIVLDYAGFRTFDSMVRARAVFGQDEFIVVSQRYHLQRAIFIAQSKGIVAHGYVAQDPAHRKNFYLQLGREYLSRVKAVLDCYLLGTEPKFYGPKVEIKL